MSYEPSTGWTRLTGRQVSQYGQVVEGLSNDLGERLDASELDHYWDAYSSLYARCMPSELWVLLSGRPSQFEDPDPGEPTEQQWISVTELGASLNPPATTSTVLKLLRDEGLLERKNKKDRPTQAAEGLYMERPTSQAGNFELKPGAVQRLWTYGVLVRLRARHVAPTDNSSQGSERAPSLRALVVKFPASCDRCGLDVVAGSDAYWDSTAKTIRCATCATAAAAGTGQR